MFFISLHCAGTAVCPNTTTLARGQQRPTDPGRMPGEDGHLLGVFLKCTWAQRGKRFRKTLGIDSFCDPGRMPGENGHLLGVFLKCTWAQRGTGGVYDRMGETLITLEFPQNIHRLRQGTGFGRKLEGSQRLRVFQKA